MPHFAWSLAALGILMAAALGAGCDDGFVASSSSSSTSGTGGTGGVSTSSSSSGNGGATGGTGGTFTSSGSGGGCAVKEGDCATCLHGSCGPEYCQCQDNNQCQAIMDCTLVTCSGGPGEPGCFAKCATSGNVGAAAIALAAELTHCGAPACPACPFEDFGACQTCLLGSCSTQLGLCFAGDDQCMNDLACLLGCQGTSTPTECAAGCLADAGTTAIDAVAACGVNHCNADCAYMATTG